jgi:hypothetical protein
MSHENLILVDLAMIFLLKCICVVLGYKIIKLGYTLLSDGVKGKFNFSLNYHGIKSGLVSASPGLLFVFLGVCLIVAGLWINKNIQFESAKKSNSFPVLAPIKSDSLN